MYIRDCFMATTVFKKSSPNMTVSVTSTFINKAPAHVVAHVGFTIDKDKVTNAVVIIVMTYVS